jgi:hypothetical protein
VSVPDESYYVPDESYYVPDESYYVPDESYYVPDESYYVPVVFIGIMVISATFSTIFQLYRVGQLYLCRKPDVTAKLYHNVVSSTL